MDRAVAVIILYAATICTVAMHIKQGVYAGKMGPTGISVGSEFGNLLVSVSLLLYGIYLKDAPLVVARVLIVGGWWFRFYMARRNYGPTTPASN